MVAYLRGGGVYVGAPGKRLKPDTFTLQPCPVWGYTASRCNVKFAIEIPDYLPTLVLKKIKKKLIVIFLIKISNRCCVLFSPMVTGWAGGLREKVCPGCISETLRCRKLILGRDIG